MSVIKVGMADLKISKSPDILTTIGLGSCIGFTIYDKTLKIGGMAHIMLPYSFKKDDHINKAKYADTAVELMLDKLLSCGVTKENMVCKIAGGAKMFDIKIQDEKLNIGDRNYDALIKQMMLFDIPIAAKDVGGNYGRTIEFDLSNGKLKVKTIGHGVLFI